MTNDEARITKQRRSPNDEAGPIPFVIRHSDFVIRHLSAAVFFYFDLGNVLLYFDHEIGCRQMADVAGLTTADVRRVLLEGGLLWRYEDGRLSREQFYDAFCRETNTCADIERLENAASDIFWLNTSMLPVVTRLKDAGYRTGVLSNTCESHWQFILAHFRALFPAAFDVLALSFRLGAAKPDERVFARAADLAGVAPSDIFYCDDIAANVAAARRAGFDAVQYTDTAALVAEIRRRGVRFNY
jgi:putative hydrolase of the HAD superfamily